MRTLLAISLLLAASSARGDGDADAEAARALNAEGMRLYRMHQFAAAKERFESAIARDSDHGIAYYNLACVDSLLHDYPGAAKALAAFRQLGADESVAPDPDTVEAKIARDPDLAYYRQERKRAAAAERKLYARAMQRCRAGDLPTALVLLRQVRDARELDALPPYDRLRVGSLLHDLAVAKEAIESLDEQFDPEAASDRISKDPALDWYREHVRDDLLPGMAPVWTAEQPLPGPARAAALALLGGSQAGRCGDDSPYGTGAVVEGRGALEIGGRPIRLLASLRDGLALVGDGDRLLARGAPLGCPPEGARPMGGPSIEVGQVISDGGRDLQIVAHRWGDDLSIYRRRGSELVRVFHYTKPGEGDDEPIRLTDPNVLWTWDGEAKAWLEWQWDAQRFAFAPTGSRSSTAPTRRIPAAEGGR